MALSEIGEAKSATQVGKETKRNCAHSDEMGASL